MRTTTSRASPASGRTKGRSGSRTRSRDAGRLAIFGCTTSPRLKGIIDIHLRTVPILSKRSQSAPEIGGLVLIDSPLAKIHTGRRQESDDHAAAGVRGHWFEQFDTSVAKNTFNRVQHVESPVVSCSGVSSANRCRCVNLSTFYHATSAGDMAGVFRKDARLFRRNLARENGASRPNLRRRSAAFGHRSRLSVGWHPRLNSVAAPRQQ